LNANKSRSVRGWVAHQRLNPTFGSGKYNLSSQISAKVVGQKFCQRSESKE